MNRIARLSLARFCRQLVLLIALLTLFFLGVDRLHHTGVYNEYAAFLPQWVPLDGMTPYLQYILAGFSILLPIMYYTLSMVVTRLERGIIGRDEDGKEFYLEPALLEKEIAKKVSVGIKEIRKVTNCSVIQGTGGPIISAKVIVGRNVPLPALQKKVKTVVLDLLLSELGHSRGAKISIKIVGIGGGGGSSSGKKRKKSSQEKTDNQSPEEKIS